MYFSREQAILFGCLGGAILLIVVGCVCIMKDVRCCNSDKTLREKCCTKYVEIENLYLQSPRIYETNEHEYFIFIILSIRVCFLITSLHVAFSRVQ